MDRKRVQQLRRDIYRPGMEMAAITPGQEDYDNISVQVSTHDHTVIDHSYSHSLSVGVENEKQAW